MTPHNIRQLKKLNSVVFPISYTDKVGFHCCDECYKVELWLEAPNPDWEIVIWPRRIRGGSPWGGEQTQVTL